MVLPSSPGPALLGALRREQRAHAAREGWTPLPGPSAVARARPPHTAGSRCVPSAVPQPPPRLVRACRRVPGLPGTCGLFSRRPPPSRRSERPSTLDGLGRGRGRPLVAAAAVAAARAVGGTRGSSPARPLPDKGVGVPSRTGAPRQAVSRPELSRTTITHEEKPRPRTVRGWFQGHVEGR